MTVTPYPDLALAAFTTSFPAPLGERASPDWLVDGLRLDADVPFDAPDDAVRAAVRDLLRARGYKPTGRGKPASEYLLRAAAEGVLSGINAAVDACNLVSLHSGLPISVVDLDRTRGPLRVDVGAPGEAYVFNPAGHEIAVGGLLGLFDADGPCANAVRDSQRTKTHAGTTRTLSILWAPASLAERTRAAEAWYRALLARLGATTTAEPEGQTTRPRTLDGQGA